MNPGKITQIIGLPFGKAKNDPVIWAKGENYE